MCDPISAIVGLAATAGSALFGGSRRAAAPPAPQIAAQPISPVDAAKPVVQVGNDDGNETPDSNGGALFAPKRKSGTAIGGLGKSAIDLNL